MILAMIVLWPGTGDYIYWTVRPALTAAHQQTAQARRIRSNDRQLREFAITSPTPTYPPASLAKKVAGPVVAAIRTDPKGLPEGVQILQAPDTYTGRAVHDALMRWAFRPMVLGMEGIVVFYFRIEGTRGIVLSPSDMREVTNPGAKNVGRADEPPVKSMTDQEFRVLSTQSRPVVLDIRDRETFAEGHENGAVNIPFGEILTRGPAELRASHHIVIDCRDPPDVCALAAHQLTSSGFSEVSTLRR
jgi:rhodanese-related sulfurtransferase